MKLLKLNPRTIFLLDGAGAFISAFLLLILLAPFEKVFGMPKEISYNLSIPALALTMFSLGCYFLKVKNWKPFLRTIIVANSLYCCVTLAFVIQLNHLLTIPGIIYFLGEIIIISLLIIQELLLLKRS